MNRDIRNSRRSHVVALLILLPWIAFVGWLSSSWALPLIVGIFFVVRGLRAFFDSRPKITISNEGLYDRRLGIGRIAWDDIDSASAFRGVKGGPSLVLKLRNADVYHARLFRTRPLQASLMRLLAPSQLQLSFDGLDASASDIAAVINEIIATRSKTPSN